MIEQVKNSILAMISRVLDTLTDQEVVGVSKLFAGYTNVSPMEAKMGLQESESLKIINEHTDETAIHDVEKMVENDIPPGDILSTLINDAGDEKSKLIRVITNSGFQLKPGTEYTIPLLKEIVGEIQKLSGDTVKREPPPHKSIGHDGVPDMSGKFPPPPKKEAKFDYTKVNVEKSVESEDTINDKINDLITKIGGDKLSDDSLILITTWNTMYTPSQIYGCLNRSWNQSAFTLKHTDSLLRSTFPPPPTAEETNQNPTKVGNFRLDTGS